MSGRSRVWATWTDWALPIRVEFVPPIRMTGGSMGDVTYWPWQLEVQIGPFHAWTIGGL